jgi:hypothetical protein
MAYKIEYDIVMNEHGRPCILPLNDIDQHSMEHKFLAYEITRSALVHSFKEYKKNPEKYTNITEDQVKSLEAALVEVTSIADLYARTILEQRKVLTETDMLFNKFEVEVDTEEERNNLNYNGFFYNERLFKREPGLRVKVKATGEVFELQNGIDNEHWVNITVK